MNINAPLIPEFDADRFTAIVDLVALRDRLGWTQADLAEFLGNGRASVARWEGGAAVPAWAQRQYWRLHWELETGQRVARPDGVQS